MDHEKLPVPAQGLLLLAGETVSLAVPVAWMQMRMTEIGRYTTALEMEVLRLDDMSTAVPSPESVRATLKEMASPDSTLFLTNMRLIWARGDERRSYGTPAAMPLGEIREAHMSAERSLSLNVGEERLVYMGKPRHLQKLLKTLATRSRESRLPETTVYELRGEAANLVCGECGWRTVRASNCGACGSPQRPEVGAACGRCRTVLHDSAQVCPGCGATE